MWLNHNSWECGSGWKCNRTFDLRDTTETYTYFRGRPLFSQLAQWSSSHQYGQWEIKSISCCFPLFIVFYQHVDDLGFPLGIVWFPPTILMAAFVWVKYFWVLQKTPMKLINIKIHPFQRRWLGRNVQERVKTSLCKLLYVCEFLCVWYWKHLH